MKGESYGKFWLPHVVSRICIFLFIFSILTMTLYMAGNFQGFLDSSQVMLMKLFEQAAILHLITTVYYALLIISSAVRGEKIRIRAILVLSGAAIITGALLGIVKFITVWVEGYIT